MSVAFIFPGQGSQAIGMGKALYDAFPASRAVFDEVDAALGQKLSTLMFEGAPEDLMLTANAQPALMAVSLAALRALETKRASASNATRVSSPVTRSVNIRLSPPPARCRLAMRPDCCACAARPCRRPCRSARAPWRRCSARSRNWRRASLAKRLPHRDFCAKWPMTMAAARSSFPAPDRRSNWRSKSPKPTESSAPCCCRSPRPSIAR